MDTRQIRYFLAVVEHGGFGRAAAALNVAQPTMSQSVKALERDVGTALFHRASHGVTLSAAGRAFLGPARLLMRDVAVAGEAVGGRPEHDSLEIVAAAPLGAHPGAALVGGFLRAHPGVSVSLDRDTDEALLARVRDGVSELGLVHLPAARQGLCEVRLGAHDLVLAFPPPDAGAATGIPDRPLRTVPDAARFPGPPDGPDPGPFPDPPHGPDLALFSGRPHGQEGLPHRSEGPPHGQEDARSAGRVHPPDAARFAAPVAGAVPDAVHLADLAGVDLLGVPRGSASRLLVESALRAAGVRTRIVVESGQRDLIADLVVAGVGAAFMPDVAAHEAAARGAVIRRIVPALRLPYGLVHRTGELSGTARAFIDHALRQR